MNKHFYKLRNGNTRATYQFQFRDGTQVNPNPDPNKPNEPNQGFYKNPGLTSLTSLTLTLTLTQVYAGNSNVGQKGGNWRVRVEGLGFKVRVHVRVRD